MRGAEPERESILYTNFFYTFYLSYSSLYYDNRLHSIDSLMNNKIKDKLHSANTQRATSPLSIKLSSIFTVNNLY